MEDTWWEARMTPHSSIEKSDGDEGEEEEEYEHKHENEDQDQHGEEAQEKHDDY